MQGRSNRRHLATVLTGVCLCLGSSLQSVSAAALVELTFHKQLIAEAVERRVQALQRYKLVLLIDKSHSMGKIECPVDAQNGSVPTLSNWEWCHQQLYQLTSELAQATPVDARIVAFSDDEEQFGNCDLGMLNNIFGKTVPHGATRATVTLKHVASDYFKQRQGQTTDLKPLLIVMISDGRPDFPNSFKHLVVDITKKMRRADEIRLVMMQVGGSDKASNFFREMEAGPKGVRHPIVEVVPFQELQQKGLVQALCDVITAPVAASTAGLNY